MSPRLAPITAAMTALALAAVPAHAAYPGENGAIAFVGERAEEQVLYVRERGRTTGLLRGGGLADPVFSPLGRRIAVTRDLPDIGRAVWVLDAAGTSRRPLTAPELTGSAPTWAPSGERIAYASGPVGARTIRIVRLDGRVDRPLTTGPGDQFDPAWSTQGVIAFVQDGPGGEDIYTVPDRGGTPRRLTSKAGDDKDPAWSPAGDRLAFVRGTGGIWVMSRFGRGARRVVNVPGGVEDGIAWSPDGSRLLFAGGPPGLRRIFSVRLDGKDLRPLSLPTSNGEDPDWQPAGHDPIIAAAGDPTCPPDRPAFNGGLGTRTRCAAMRTSDILLRPDLSAVLPLGDVQTPRGELHYFFQGFGPSWGRLKAITRPTPGNHDYLTPGAQGYFDYFNGVGARRGPAGDRERGGYYSFELGEWRLIALDSNCGQLPGGCGVGSPQQRWLARTLARDPKRCTLAYWHHPRFSSFAVEGGRGPKATVALWQTLYDAGVDLVLSGHQHFYERLAPQDGNGNLDRVRGIRSFVVGTGGHSLDQAEFRDRNSMAFSADAFGVLQLRLRPNGYDYRLRSAGPEEYFDDGRARCN